MEERSGDSGQTQSQVAELTPQIVRRRRVQWFKRADRWFNHLLRLAGVMHEGFWLGCLSVEDLNAVTADHYFQSQECTSQEHNLRGLFNWETSVLGRYFRPGSRILVGAAGGGREVLALRRAGFQAEGFECNPILLQAGNGVFERLGEPDRLTPCAVDQVPPGPGVYDGLIVGWAGYTHIPTRARRVAFLQGLRRRALPGAPVLLSFFTRSQGSRYETCVHRMAKLCHILLRGRKEAPDLGDHLSWSYSHFFTREEVEGEMRAGGFQLVHFSELDYSHAVGIARDLPADADGV